MFMWRARLPHRIFRWRGRRLQGTLNGAQNIFIAVINPLLQPPTYTAANSCFMRLIWAGRGRTAWPDLRSTSSSVFTLRGRPIRQTFLPAGRFRRFRPRATGTHGFLSKIAFPTSPASSVYGLAYSTYLSGNGVDNVTGLAIDTAQNAYVTGDTTSTNPVSNGFPANANGFQTSSNSPGNPQFFATMVNTLSGGISYSTYYGGGNFAGSPAANVGGGIAVDPPPNTTPNIYFTGTTNMISLPGTSGQAALPLFAAQQSCLDQPAVTGTLQHYGAYQYERFRGQDQSQPGGVQSYLRHLSGRERT
jgi:hypothetical protein